MFGSWTAHFGTGGPGTNYALISRIKGTEKKEVWLDGERHGFCVVTNDFYEQLLRGV